MRDELYHLFLDLDGVVADFMKSCNEHKMDPDDYKLMKGAYRNLEFIQDAKNGVLKLLSLEIKYGFKLWFATKTPTDNTHAYSEKAEWIHENLPELKKRIIITHNKGLLGGEQDILIDDRKHKAECNDFKGTFIHYGVDVKNWVELLDRLHQEMLRRNCGWE